jgi:pilus assembly protein CpaB
MVVSLGFGLIAAIGISQVMGKGGKAADQNVQRKPIVVSTTDLTHGTELTKENVKVENWPAELIPEGAVTKLELVENMAITVRLSKGLPIMSGDILPKSEIGKINIPRGFKLCAIPVAADDTMTGLLQPGDHVDVIGVVDVRRPENNQSQTISKTFLKNIEVFSVNDSIRNAGPRKAGSTGNSIVGLLVTEQQSEIIVLVQKVARLKLVLRGEAVGEEENVYIDPNGDIIGQIFLGVDRNAAEHKDTKTIGMGDSFVDNFATIVYNGAESFETVKFVGGKRKEEAWASPKTETESSDSDEESETADQEDYEHSNEIDSGLEEDQYPGE